MHPQLSRALKDGIFWITRRIAMGQYATEERCTLLLAQGVTHILNVGEAESLQATVATFQQVIDVPIEDLTFIPTALAVQCVEATQDIMSEPGTKLYIHCIAGQNRSPTILWLYLLACGLDADAAKRLITDRALDAVPGHGKLVGPELIKAVVSLSKSENFQPPEDSVLEPAY